LNTDLDLISSEDPTALATALEARGVFSLHVTQGEGGVWHASFETTHQHPEPAANIEAMVAAVESLRERHRLTWQRCLKREFNVGYDCHTGNAVLTHSLPTELLARVASIGASLGLTLYPDHSAAA
jgi:hypothetical protein